PIAVRYTQDAFSRSGWLWPVDAKGEPLKATSYMAVGFYVAKYVNKKSDMDLAAKGLGAKEWNRASLLVRLVVLLPFQLLRLSLATPSRWTPLALSVFLHCVVALLLTLL